MHPAAAAAAALGLGLVAACAGGRPPTAAPVPSAVTSTSRPATTAAASPRGPAVADVTGYHRDAGRTGDDPTAAAAGPMRVQWRLGLDGAVYAQPWLVRGMLVVATEHDSVYGIRDGRVVWRTPVGEPVPLSALPCGNVDPLGITGTPVYDPRSATVFAVAEVAGPIRHVLVAVDPATGAVRWRRGIDPPGMVARFQQQRAALALTAGRVWVAFGGLYGDCGPYRGWLVGVRTDGAGAAVDYAVPTRREGGIWAPSGPAVGPGGDLYVAVGNGAAGPGDRYDMSDSVLRLSGTQVVGWFAPSSWPQENDNDLDLGSMGPVFVDGGRWVVQGGKAGDVYLLDPGRLGGFDGQRARLGGCAAYGGAASRGAVVFLPCREGLLAVAVTTGPGLRRLWRSGVTGSPVVGAGQVYVPGADGRLHRLDASTGQADGSVPVGDVSRFATPVTAGPQVFVPTLAGVTAVRVGP